VVHLSSGGKRIRLRLSNVYGKTPVALGSVHVALHGTRSAIQANTDREVRFAGSKSVAIPVGQSRSSDAIELDVPAHSDVVVSFYVAAPAVITTVHAVAQATSYTAPGDQTDAVDLSTSSASGSASAVGAAAASTSTSWHVIAAVDVDAPVDTRAIVAFGDSITDGMGSSPDANHRWTDRLAERLADNHRSVINAGIAGNALTREVVSDPGLARFDRDVLEQAGVGYVIAEIGVNDLASFEGLAGVPAEDVIAGYRKLVAKARASGIKLVFATLMPTEGARFYTAEADAQRGRVNDWIRTTKEIDGFIDFDKAIRDPDKPSRVAPAFDSGDHVHPSDAGYAAMADAVDLALLR